MMEMPDGNFYDIKIEDCPENVYFDSFGNAHYTGTWVTNKCTKWKLGYVREDIVESLRRENEENCRLLGIAAEREIQLLQKVQQLEKQASYLMQNSESQTQTQMALIKKLAKTEWRPIESAPHGIWVLIFAYGNVCQACWNSNGYWSTFRENRIQPIAATHWMPLPEPPTTEEIKCLK